MKPKYWIYVFLLVGGILRFWGLGDKSFWVDELQSIRVSRYKNNIIPYCQSGNTPPLRYYLVHYLQKFYPAESFVRLPSVVCGILSLPFIFLLVRRVFDQQVAVVATTLFAFSPWHIFHSQDGRMYSVFLFLAIVSLYLIFLALEKNKLYYWALLGATMALNAYLSYFALWTSFITLLFFGLIYILKILKRQGLPELTATALVRGVVLCFIVTGVVYAPWLYNLRYLLKKYNFYLTLRSQTDKPVPVEVSKPDYQPNNIRETKVEPAPQGTTQTIYLNPFVTKFNWDYIQDFAEKLGCKNRVISFALVALFLLGLGLAFKANRSFFLLSLLWIMVPVVILIIMSVRWFFPPRYLIYYHPVFIILASLGLFKISSMMSSVIGGRFSVVRCPLSVSRSLILALLATIIVFFFSKDDIAYYHQEKQNWRDAVKYLEAVTADGDVVVTGQAWSELGLIYYHRDDTKKVDVITKCYDLDKFDQLLARYQPLWYINWGPLPEPVKQKVDRYLALQKTFPGILGNIEIYKKERQDKSPRN